MSTLRRGDEGEEGRFYLCTRTGEFKKTRWTEGGVERTRGELDAALRRAKQLSKALREWEVRREDTRNALAASDAALQASEARLEDMLQRTVDALVLIHERDGKRKKRPQPAAAAVAKQQEGDATANTTPTTTATSATGNQVAAVVVEEEVELIMKTIVGPLLDGVGATTATKAPTGAPRKTAAAKPVKVKRSRPSKGKQQQQQQATVEPVG